VVGIAPDVRQANVEEPEPDPVAYLPFRIDPRGFMVLLARSEGDPAGVISLVRGELRAVDADLPLFNIRTMDEALARQRWPFRVFGTMFAIFAGIALVLSGVGLYAVTAYSVTQRTQEIGVRTALGAASKDVMWLFMRRALFHLGIGLSLGVLAALGVGKIFEATELLVRINGRDPVTLVSIAGLLATVALTASIWPARRATRLDPLVALRHE
jgi:putative ABC transport system permease protein